MRDMFSVRFIINTFSDSKLCLTLHLLLTYVAFAITTANAQQDVPLGLKNNDPDRLHFKLLETHTYQFEDNTTDWQIETWASRRGLGAPTLTKATISQKQASAGATSLILPINFPNSSTACVSVDGITDWQYITFDIYIPPKTPGRIEAVFYLKDKDGLWFQTLTDEVLIKQEDGTHIKGALGSRLISGEWNTICVDLRDNKTKLLPMGHMACWDMRFARDITSIGIILCGNKAVSDKAYVDNFRVWTLSESYTQSLEILNLQFSKQTETYSCWEISFDLNRSFVNPFDPEQISVEAIILTPTEKKIPILGFFYQDCVRKLTHTGEDVQLSGKGYWKLRYAFREPGTYKFHIKISTAKQSIITRERVVRVTRGTNPGFINVSKIDSRCFEFESGTPFYPIGLNMHSPIDKRSDHMLGYQSSINLGTFKYDHIFKRMSQAGGNFIEIWMSSWWLGLEWNRKWKNYGGCGYYNLTNAWKLDYLLKQARDMGIKIHLVIDNHGKYSTWCNPEWQDSPYNKLNTYSSGFLTKPSEFFKNELAQKYYKNKMRYVLARWGYDVTIAGIELVSELNLSGERGKPLGRIRGLDHPSAPLRQEHKWHRDMIKYFNAISSGCHLYTTHYSGDHRNVDPLMARLPDINYLVCDAYRRRHTPFAGHAIGAALALEQYGKPFLVTEYGGAWYGANEAQLEADLHCGLWSSYMTSAAGTPLLWWFNFIDHRMLYNHYNAFAKFTHGEDRRDPKFKTVYPSVHRTSINETIRAIAYMTKRRGYAWVYVDRAMGSYLSNSIIATDIRISLKGIDNGLWHIEFWDTIEGKILHKEYTQATKGELLAKLPCFKNDVAMKINIVCRPTEIDQKNNVDRDRDAQK